MRPIYFTIIFCALFAVAIRIPERYWNETTLRLSGQLSWVVVAAALLFVAYNRFRTPTRRGVSAMSFFRAKRNAASLTQINHGIYFGGLELPLDAATSHFMIVGSTGSGKTLTLRMMMGSVLPAIFTTPDQRAVVYDVKQDALSVLYGILGQTLQEQGKGRDEIEAQLAQDIVILNPFDSRCCEWDIANDVTSPEVALQIATILIPEEQSQNRYFSDAARDLLTGIINAFIEKCPGRWTLADLLFAMRSPERMRHILNQTDEGRDLISLHLEGGNTTKSVVSTARSKLAPYEVVAALWHHAGKAGRKISLREFLKSNRIIVLGNNQAALAPIQAINRVLFQRLTELLLDQSENDRRRNWFFLDEVRKLGRLEGLDDLMTNGRSKGAAVVLGFQDIDGMRAVYGKEVAGEITSMCASYGVLRVSGASTPQWASEILGEQEIIQKMRSSSDTVNSQDGSFTTGLSEQIRERKLYLPSTFRIIPRAEKGKSLHGYFCSAFLGSQPYNAEIPAAELNERLLPLGSQDLNFHAWPSSTSKKLPIWEDDDYKRLNIEQFIAPSTQPNEANSPGESAVLASESETEQLVARLPELTGRRRKQSVISYTN